MPYVINANVGGTYYPVGGTYRTKTEAIGWARRHAGPEWESWLVLQLGPRPGQYRTVWAENTDSPGYRACLGRERTVRKTQQQTIRTYPVWHAVAYGGMSKEAIMSHALSQLPADLRRKAKVLSTGVQDGWCYAVVELRTEGTT